MASLVLFFVNTGIVFSGITQNIDGSLALYLNNSNLGSLTEMMILLSRYGREVFWLGVLAVMIVLGSKETKLLGVELAVLFVGGIIVGDVLKAVLFRPRPFDTLTGIITRVPTEPDSAYPSGHALIVSIGGVFSLVKFRRKWVAALLTLEAGLVSFSRVYVGVHYPLDVLGGVLAANTIVFLGLFLLEKYGSHWGGIVEYVFGKTLGNGPLKV